MSPMEMARRRTIQTEEGKIEPLHYREKCEEATQMQK